MIEITFIVNSIAINVGIAWIYDSIVVEIVLTYIEYIVGITVCCALRDFAVIGNVVIVAIRVTNIPVDTATIVSCDNESVEIAITVEIA
jgi:hypothetical protein